MRRVRTLCFRVHLSRRSAGLSGVSDRHTKVHWTGERLSEMLGARPSVGAIARLSIHMTVRQECAGKGCSGNLLVKDMADEQQKIIFSNLH